MESDLLGGGIGESLQVFCDSGGYDALPRALGCAIDGRDRVTVLEGE